MKIIIIGAGQLGSRHLQALRNTKHSLEITVCDSSPDSLKVARERYESLPEVGHHKIEYAEKLPRSGAWDLSIVATNAAPRRQILEYVIQNFNISNFIIEKLLFTKEADYLWAEKLAGSSLKNAWVNCCMRQMPAYQEIKTDLKNQKFHFSVTGANYGLVTNAIHYLDYAAWLAGTNEFTVDTSKLDKKIVASKRPGYLELNGVLTAEFRSGATASITCFEDGSLPVTVEVHSNSQRYVVLESERKMLFWSAEKKWIREERDAVIPYQSQLTTQTVDCFYNNKPCPLPKLSDSLRVHQNLLKPLHSFLRVNGVNEADEYPFT
jgi:predicted dehydrogenase